MSPPRLLYRVLLACPCTEGWASQELRPALVHSSGWAGSFCIPLFKRSREVSSGRSWLPIPNSRRTGSIRFSLVSELDPLSAGLGPVPAHSHVWPSRTLSGDRASPGGIKSQMQAAASSWLTVCILASRGSPDLPQPPVMQQEEDRSTSGQWPTLFFKLHYGGMWDFSSPARDWTHAPRHWKHGVLNHWTTR